MSSANTSAAITIAEIKNNMILCIKIWSFCLFILGLIGHTLNIYVFTRPKFRFNPCTRYFLASTLSGYAVVCLIVPLRLLQISYNVDVFISSFIMCHILTYILACIRFFSSYKI